MRPISIKKEVYFTRGLHTRKVMQDSPPPEPSQRWKCRRAAARYPATMWRDLS